MSIESKLERMINKNLTFTTKQLLDERRCEFAKAAMLGHIANPEILRDLNGKGNGLKAIAQFIARLSITYADALIEEIIKAETVTGPAND